MGPSFRQGFIEMPKYDSKPFHYPELPDEEKKILCRDLLAEFGATSITEHGQELKHSCVMPFHNDSNPLRR